MSLPLCGVQKCCNNITICGIQFPAQLFLESPAVQYPPALGYTVPAFSGPVSYTQQNSFFGQPFSSSWNQSLIFFPPCPMIFTQVTGSRFFVTINCTTPGQPTASIFVTRYYFNQLETPSQCSDGIITIPLVSSSPILFQGSGVFNGNTLQFSLSQ